MTKHVKYTYLYLFKFVLYSIVAFKVDRTFGLIRNPLAK